MASNNHSPLSPLLRRPNVRSPTLTAVRPSSLSSGSLRSYPVTASSFGSSPRFSSEAPSSPRFSSPDPCSSPQFSFTRAAASQSPDIFEEFPYSEDMEEDFGRIDADSAAILEADLARQGAAQGPSQALPPQNNPTPASPRVHKTWVVFRGKAPGLYCDL